ncbi:double-stranded RNA-binding protein 1-like [Fagus crenata]
MYKTKLQELCHQKLWNLPEYMSKKEGPDHNPRFSATATLTINNKPLTFHSSNSCKSSKEAQNDAARSAYLHFTQPPPPPPPLRPSIPYSSSSSSSFAPFPQPSLSSSSSGIGNADLDIEAVTVTTQTLQPNTQQTPHFNALPLNNNFTVIDMQHLYKNQLQNYVQKRNLSLPAYSCEREGPPHASRFRCKVTIDGHTYESPEFFSTLKDAEHAAAKVALKSLSPDEAKEDDSGLYKNLLQELVQKEGFSLPVYDTKRSGEVHVPIFVSTVEIDREIFKGHEARTKKQAEMSAAKIAYTTLKARKSGQGPLIVCPAHKGQEAPEFSSSSFQPNVTADRQQHVGPKATMNLNPCTIAERQAGEDRASATVLSSGPDTITTSNQGSSFETSYGCVPETFFSAPCMSENGRPSHSSTPDYSTNLVMDSSPVLPAGISTSSCKRVFVHPRMPNMTTPTGCTMLPMSDDKWVAFSSDDS